MKRLFGAAIVSVCLSLCAGVTLAQGESSFIFGEYYVCDQNREGFANTLVERIMAPIYDKHVKEGHLTGWGWLAHNAGGRWRRVLYYSSNDLDTLLQTRDKMIEELQSELADTEREFTSICPEHDDLIWQAVAGTPIDQQLADTAAESYSTYYVCDVSKQERADEIVKQLIAPEIDKLVKSGEIKSWGWYEHVIGGRYRRLMTHRGATQAGLLAAVVKYNDAATAADAALAEEFSQICNSHADYLWDVVLPKAASN